MTGQPDLRQRIADAIDGAMCNAAYYEIPGAADAVLAVVQPEIDQLRARVAELEREQAESDDEINELMNHNDENCEVVKERDRYAALLREYVDLVAVAHRYPIQGGHDCLGANLTCAGCGIADRARTALETS